jgi:hypothetical protein
MALDAGEMRKLVIGEFEKKLPTLVQEQVMLEICEESG